jgi:hypothetical protein
MVHHPLMPAGCGSTKQSLFVTSSEAVKLKRVKEWITDHTYQLMQDAAEGETFPHTSQPSVWLTRLPLALFVNLFS